MNAYIRSLYARNALQWQNYTQSAHRDLNPIYAQIREALTTLQSRGELPLSALRNLIETEPRIAALRNKLDDGDSYRSVGEIGTAPFLAAIRSDVTALMQLRNLEAQRLGYRDYPAAIFASEQLDEDAILASLSRFLAENLPATRRFVAEHRFQWRSWFDDLSRISQPLSPPVRARDVLRELAAKLQLDEVLARLSIVEGQPICFVLPLAADDIRMSLGEMASLDDLRTLCHEFGHAVQNARLLSDSPQSLAQLTPLREEAAAVLMETLAPRLLVSEQQAALIRQVQLMDYCRAALSMQFELQLWHHGCDAAEELCRDHFEQLGVVVEEPRRWCLDSFRSIDCVYIGNYPLSQIAADKLLHAKPQPEQAAFDTLLETMCSESYPVSCLICSENGEQ